MDLHATLGTALRNSMKRPPDDEVSDMKYRFRSPLEPEPGGFAGDVRMLERSAPPTDLQPVDVNAQPSGSIPVSELPTDRVGRAPAPPVDRSIKEAATARRLTPLAEIKSAAGGSPRYVPPPAPKLDLNAAVENMPRSMLSTRGDDLTAGAENMRPPSDPTNLRDPLGAEMERLSPSYSDYQAERDRLPTEQEYLDQNEPQGFGGRLLSAAKLGGKFLVASGLNPIVALEGLAIGAADKDANARYTYRTDIEPRSVERQRRQLSFAGNELGMANTIEDNRRANEQIEFDRDRLGRAEERENEMFPLRRRLLTSQVAENEAQAERALRPPTVRELAPHWVLDDKGEYVDLNAQQPRRSGIRGPVKESDATSDDYEAQILAGKDLSTELTQRMDDLRGAVYQRFGIDPGNTQDSLPETIAKAEEVLHARVKEAMELERKQEAARARVAGRRLSARPQGGWPRATMEQAKSQARSMVAGILNDPKATEQQKANARAAYRDEFKEEYR
jgi:hypothetical protein